MEKGENGGRLLFHGGSIKGYLVIGISPFSIRRGTLLDYAENKSGAVEKILQYIMESDHFYSLSIPSYGLNNTMIQTLKRLDLYQSLLSQMEAKEAKKELPLLVRPVKKTISDNDWLINGFDIRNIDNWEIKPICSDTE